MRLLFLAFFLLSGQPSLERGSDLDADRPTRTPVFRPSGEQPDGEGGAPLPDWIPAPNPEPELPPEPGPDPDPKPEGPPPTFFDEVVPQDFIFLVDTSGSMISAAGGPIEDNDGNVITSPVRLDVLKIELVKTIRSLPDGYSFDMLHFPSKQFPATAWRGGLVEANQSTRGSAEAWAQSLIPFGGTPLAEALLLVCQSYPPDVIDKLFVLCDGSFNQPDNFPGWFFAFKQNGCVFVGIHIGPYGLEHMAELVESVQGTLKHVE